LELVYVALVVVFLVALFVVVFFWFEAEQKKEVFLEWQDNGKISPWVEGTKDISWYAPPSASQVITAFYSKKTKENPFLQGFSLLGFKESVNNGAKLIRVKILKKFESMLVSDGWIVVDSLDFFGTIVPNRPSDSI
jgi:hypothetical protein